MPLWIFYSVIVIVLWGVVGLFQKLGTNRISARSLLVWLTVGYLVLIPVLLRGENVTQLKWPTLLIGLLAGFTNGLGAWCLLSSLESGAKASIVVPLTALNPLVTIFLAISFLHERLSLLQWAGVGVALVAGAMISYEKEPS